MDSGNDGGARSLYERRDTLIGATPVSATTQDESPHRDPEEPPDEPSGEPDLKRALRPVPQFERAVREVSRMLSEAGIRHALVGALGANAYRNRPRTTEDIAFLVGDEAFQAHPGGFVTMRVPVIEVDGIDVDQVPLTPALRVVEEGLNRAPVSDGVPIAALDTIVVMKLLAGRTQDLADIEAIVASGADRELLTAAVETAAPDRIHILRRLFDNVDSSR